MAKTTKKAGNRGTYDWKAARQSGAKPDSSGHWPSRNPKSGRILKREDHPTFDKTIQGEEKAGHKMYRHKGSGNPYSFPKDKNPGPAYKPYRPKKK